MEVPFDMNNFVMWMEAQLEQLQWMASCIKSKLTAYKADNYSVETLLSIWGGSFYTSDTLSLDMPHFS